MKILVLKTSTDATIRKLFDELDRMENKEIDCLIQSSQISMYKKSYPDINFIDIRRERFENLPLDVLDMISRKKYNELYITLSGIHGYNFWNVMELVNGLRFRKGFFYDCNGKRLQIPRKNTIRDTLCRLYIKLLGSMYQEGKN